jgi:hypothetical protein
VKTPDKDEKFLCEFFEKFAEKCADDLPVLQKLGELYSTTGRHRDGLKVDLRASLLAPENPIVHYNLACSFARCGQPQFAIDHITLAIRLGFSGRQSLLEDPDLDSIRHLPEFRRLLKSF